MNKNIKLSVIVPVYKVEKYLEECVDSILMQDYSCFELILVDDGSPDNCPEICDRYAGQDSRVKVIHKTNAGVATARNTGLDNATGDYIVWVDSDDLIKQGYFSALVESISSSDSVVDVVYAAPTQRIKRYFAQKVYNGAEIRKDVLMKFIGNKKLDPPLWCQVWQLCTRREMVTDLRFPLLRMIEDKPYFLEVLLRSNRMNVLDDTYYRYRRNISSLTNTNEGEKLLQGNIAANHYIWEVLKKYGMDTPYMRRMMDNSIISDFIEQYRWYAKKQDRMPSGVYEHGENYKEALRLDEIFTWPRAISLTLFHGSKWFWLKYDRNRLLRIFWKYYHKKGHLECQMKDGYPEFIN